MSSAVSDHNIRFDQILRFAIHQIEGLLNLIKTFQPVIQCLSGMDAAALDQADHALDDSGTARTGSAFDGNI